MWRGGFFGEVRRGILGEVFFWCVCFLGVFFWGVFFGVCFFGCVFLVDGGVLLFFLGVGRGRGRRGVLGVLGGGVFLEEVFWVRVFFWGREILGESEVFLVEFFVEFFVEF